MEVNLTVGWSLVTNTGIISLLFIFVTQEVRSEVTNVLIREVERS